MGDMPRLKGPMAPTRRSRKPSGPRVVREATAVAARRAQRILERGPVYFFYQSKVGTHDPTKTRGLRQLPPARLAGEGIYAVVRHDDRSHLAYVLEIPHEPGKVRRALNIVEGGYVVAVKNRQAPPDPSWVSLTIGAPGFRSISGAASVADALSPSIRPLFLTTRTLKSSSSGARQNVAEQLGTTFNREHETETAAAIVNDLKLERDVHPLKPLFKGQWA